MEIIGELTKGIELPKMVKIKQRFNKDHIPKEQIHSIVFEQLNRDEIKSQIQPNMNIAITCGSRGVANINIIMKAIVDFVIENKGNPFIVPAMGSHGGANADGQKQILFDYGVTEEFVGCPIISSMDTKQIGITEQGHPIYVDRNAAEADAIIVCGRIKTHTGFHGTYESGLMKMLAIGLGKQKGAEVVHEAGFGMLHHLIPLFANSILARTNVIFGLGIIENAYDQTYKLLSLTKEEIPLKEPKLLIESKEIMGKILFDSTDVLVVDKIGKNYSGDGMDPNVTGRFGTTYASGGIKAEKVVALDLSDETRGNANGIGLADITTKRLVDKINLDITYPNAITSTLLVLAKIPLYVKSDLDAIRLGIKTCNYSNKQNPKIIRIKNTSELEYIYISEALLEEAKHNPNIEILGGLEDFQFDVNGNLF